MRFLTVAVTSAFALGLLLPAAVAFHEDDLPFVAGGGGPGAGWVGLTLTAENATVALDVTAQDVALPGQGGMLVYDADGALVFGFAFTALSGKTGVLVDLHPAPGTLDVRSDTFMPSQPGGMMGAGLTFEEFDDTVKILAWFAGSASSWAWAVRGTDTTEVLASVEGDDTFLYTSEDFSGAANVQAYAQGTGGRVVLGGEVVEEIENGLSGIFIKLVSSVDTLTVERPDGTSQGCPCFFTGGGPTGAYTFGLTGAGGGTFSLDEVVLGGADGYLPA